MKRGAEDKVTKEEEKEEKEEAEEETLNPPSKKRAVEKDDSEKKEESVEKKDESEEKKDEGEEKKEEEKKNETPAFTFSFGSSASAGTTPFKFDFSSTAPTFSFGTAPATGPFSFSFAKTIPLEANASEENKDGEEGEDDPEKDLTTYDGPAKVKTLSKEELLNGEEGEDNVYTVPKCKLFELQTVKIEKSEEDPEKKEEKDESKKEVSEKKVWQERGLGVLRLNVDKKTHTARILIRREPTHQSIANFNLIRETKSTVDPVRKHVSIQTIEPVVEDPSETDDKDAKKEEKPKAKISFYMIRVSSKEIAEELNTKINELIPKDEKN